MTDELWDGVSMPHQTEPGTNTERESRESPPLPYGTRLRVILLLSLACWALIGLGAYFLFF